MNFSTIFCTFDDFPHFYTALCCIFRTTKFLKNPQQHRIWFHKFKNAVIERREFVKGE